MSILILYIEHVLIKFFDIFFYAQEHIWLVLMKLLSQECQAFATVTVSGCLEPCLRQLDVALVLLYVTLYMLRVIDN